MKLFDLILLDKQEIVKKGIYVPDLTDTIQESVRPVIEKRNIRLVVKSCPVWICGDSDLLKTVFINMLDNASKASKSGDTVMLRVRCRNNVVLFEVIDRGIGILRRMWPGSRRLFIWLTSPDPGSPGALGLEWPWHQKL